MVCVGSLVAPGKSDKGRQAPAPGCAWLSALRRVVQTVLPHRPWGMSLIRTCV